MKNKKIIPASILVTALFYLTLISGCLKSEIQSKAIYFTDPLGTGSVLRALTVDDKGGNLGISVSSSVVVPSDIMAEIKVDTSYVARFNNTNGTKYKPLPSKFFSIASNEVKIHAGASISDIVQLDVKPFDNTVVEG
ncbi:MAG: DUF1735 domain-containing protein [Sphingobacteriales bacterium]|nr:DUF1735 domain-containing protein [Sphingobacteriales bacterium]